MKDASLGPHSRDARFESAPRTRALVAACCMKFTSPSVMSAAGEFTDNNLDSNASPPITRSFCWLHDSRSREAELGQRGLCNWFLCCKSLYHGPYELRAI